jgi:hypothetical protein
MQMDTRIVASLEEQQAADKMTMMEGMIKALQESMQELLAVHRHKTAHPPVQVMQCNMCTQVTPQAITTRGQQCDNSGLHRHEDIKTQQNSNKHLPLSTTTCVQHSPTAATTNSKERQPPNRPALRTASTPSRRRTHQQQPRSSAPAGQEDSTSAILPPHAVSQWPRSRSAHTKVSPTPREMENCLQVLRTLHADKTSSCRADRALGNTSTAEDWLAENMAQTSLLRQRRKRGQRSSVQNVACAELVQPKPASMMPGQVWLDVVGPHHLCASGMLQVQSCSEWVTPETCTTYCMLHAWSTKPGVRLSACARQADCQ